MTTERAVDILSNFTGYKLIYPVGREDEIPTVDEMLEAVKMAVEALRKELKDEVVQFK